MVFVFEVLLLFVMSISSLQGFLVSPSIFSSFSEVGFRGLAAAPRLGEGEPNNNSHHHHAFDLVDEALRESLSKELGIVEPNEVQNSTLPIAIGGDDVFVIAQTGSGKTMSFMLPILHRLKNSTSSSAIVIGPTPELLAQHSAIARKLSSSPSLVDRILFKTPEEVLDRSNNAEEEDDDNNSDLANIDIVAIDEVDAVLCGSEFDETTPETSIELLGRFPDGVQYILTTAHLTRAHTKVINELFPDIQTVRQSSSSRRVLVPTLRQEFHYFSGNTMEPKLDKLRDVLLKKSEKQQQQQTIIFCKDQKEVEVVHAFLLENRDSLSVAFGGGAPPQKLHVELSSEERSRALSDFKNNSNDSCRMLVTHEICARGLDAPVNHVVLFDTPTDVTAFVHRAGRTARAGEEGIVSCLIQGGGALGLGGGGGSFGQHKNLHALLDAPKLNFAKAASSADGQ